MQGFWEKMSQPQHACFFVDSRVHTLQHISVPRTPLEKRSFASPLARVSVWVCGNLLWQIIEKCRTAPPLTNVRLEACTHASS